MDAPRVLRRDQVKECSPGEGIAPSHALLPRLQKPHRVEEEDRNSNTRRDKIEKESLPILEGQTLQVR